MRKLFPAILFCLILSQGYGQQWKWWAANFLDDPATQIHEIAASPKGGAAMVVSTDKANTAGILDKWAGLQNSLLITDINGVPEKVIPLRFKVLKMTYGFNGDELFIVAKDSGQNGYSHKLYVTTPLANESFGFIDSVDLFNMRGIPNRGDIDMVMVGNVLNADIAIVARAWASNIGDFSEPDNVWYLRIFLRNGRFTARTPSVYSRVYSNKKILSSCEIETLAGDVVILSNREEEGYHLLMLNPNGAIKETIKLNESVEKASISSLSGQLHLQAFFKDSLAINDSTVVREEKGWALVSFGKDFTIDNVISGIKTFDWLSDRYGSLNGKTLFDGGHYHQSFTVSPFHYYTRTGRRLGFFKFNSDLTEFDSTSFFIADFEPVPSNTIRAIMAPHSAGTYLSIPQVKTVKTLGHNVLRFPKNQSINTFTETGFDNLLLHYNDNDILLTQKASCSKSTYTITSPFLKITNSRWYINNRLVRNHSFDTITVFHREFQANTSISVRLQLSNGLGLTLKDSIYPNRHVYPKIDIPTSETCQWNPIGLRNNSASDTFSQSTSLNHIWEFWKNDTVFVSDTNAHPTVNFRKPGVYTVKYYASNGFCKQGVVLRDTITVLPAAKAEILGFPFRVCDGSKIDLTTKPITNAKSVFTWYDGTTSTSESSKIIGKDPSQWVHLSTTSSNGCVTQDSIHFRVLLSGNKLVDSVITRQDFTPIFYLSQNQGFPKFRVSRNAGGLDQVLWQKPTHRDGSVNLTTYDDGYTISGIDRCANYALEEIWHPPLLTFLEEENRLKLRPSGVGREEYWAKRKNDKWHLLSHNFSEIGLDTLSDVYQFRYREYDPNRDKAVVSNTVEVAPANAFILPNAFSPNGDGINDIFAGLKPKNTEIVSIQVFSRNGQLVQHSTEIENIWDGRIKGLVAPVGAYTYVIKYEQDGGSKSLGGGMILVK